MKNILLFVLGLFFQSGCSVQDTSGEQSYKSEVFIKMITPGSDFFEIKDENGVTLVEKLEKQDVSSLEGNGKGIKELYDVLKENDLVGKPYFHIAVSNSEKKYKSVYVNNEKEYAKLKPFLDDLQMDTQKILVEFKGKDIHENMIKCLQITSVKLVDGVTKWDK